MWGGDDADTIGGNPGDDQMWGEGGNDLLVGSEGVDIAYGGEGRDDLEGSAGDDRLHGDAGNDDLLAGRGTDLLLPGRGADKIRGGKGNDTVSFADTSSAVRVDLESEKYGKAARNDYFGQVENVIGSAGNDKLTPTNKGSAFGGEGNDKLISAKGAVMRGDEGKDRLSGDSKEKHKDVFWLDNPGTGPGDTIVRYDQGQDVSSHCRKRVRGGGLPHRR